MHRANEWTLKSHPGQAVYTTSANVYQKAYTQYRKIHAKIEYFVKENIFQYYQKSRQ